MLLFRSKDVDVCPVEAALMIMKGRAMIIAEGGKVGPDAISGTRRKDAIAWVRWAARKNGAPKCEMDRYGLHSLRVGGATVLSESGSCEMLIRLHGRWKSHVNRRYTRRTANTFAEVAERMLATETMVEKEWGWGGRPAS
jgi:hypothetical protein